MCGEGKKSFTCLSLFISCDPHFRVRVKNGGGGRGEGVGGWEGALVEINRFHTGRRWGRRGSSSHWQKERTRKWKTSVTEDIPKPIQQRKWKVSRLCVLYSRVHCPFGLVSCEHFCFKSVELISHPKGTLSRGIRDEEKGSQELS